MVRKPDIQYIHQFYVYGSEATAPDYRNGKKYSKTTLPEAAPDRMIRVRVDPVALCGIVVAAALLVMMVIGGIQYLQARQAFDTMSDYVMDLRNENIALQQEYDLSYDLADIEAKALALGMIPADQVQVMTFRSQVPQRQPEPTLWEEIRWFLSGLFA